MDYYDKLQSMAFDVSFKTLGVSHLLTNYKPDGYGDRDHEAIKGVGLILEELSEQSRKIANMLDGLNREQVEES